MSIGPRIQRRRKERGLSVVQLAKLSGIAATTLYDLERGDSKSTTKLHRVAHALGVSVDWLETGRGNPNAGTGLTPDTLHDMVITADGVRVGREWEKLREPLRTQIATMIEAAVAAQVREARAKERAKGASDNADPKH